MSIEKLRDRQWLSEQLKRGRNNLSIADEVGCSPAAVCKWLKRHDLKSQRGELQTILQDKELMFRLYVTEVRNAAQLGDLIGCDKSNVIKALKKLGIPVKDLSEAQVARYNSPGSSEPRPRKVFLDTIQNKTWLTERVAEGLNQSEIARKAKCSPNAVMQALEKFGLETVVVLPSSRTIDHDSYRSRKEWSKLGAHYHKARVITPKDGCLLCGKEGAEVNHKDCNPTNSNPSNLERLCRKCHRRQHAGEIPVMRAMLRELGVEYMAVHDRARVGLLARMAEEVKVPAAEVSVVVDDPHDELFLEDPT